jgi:hypothetical protein
MEHVSGSMSTCFWFVILRNAQASGIGSCLPLSNVNQPLSLPVHSFDPFGLNRCVSLIAYHG